MFSLYRGAYKTSPRAPTLVGSDTDALPTTNPDGSSLANGATFKTTKGVVYRWDEQNTRWLEGEEQ